MARKNNTTRRRSNKTAAKRRSRKPARDERAIRSLSGLTIILLTLTGLFKLGILGAGVQDIFKVLVGQSYPLLMVIVILYSLGLTIYAQWPRFRKRWVWGMLIFYLGLLLMLHARMFDQLGRHSDFWNQTWSSVTAAVLNDDSSMPIGGGMLGAALYSGSGYLLGSTGTKAAAVLLMIIGVVVFFDLPVQKLRLAIAQMLKQLKERFHQLNADRQARQAERRQRQPKEPMAVPSDEKDLPTPHAERKREQQSRELPEFEIGQSASDKTAAPDQQSRAPRITVASENERPASLNAKDQTDVELSLNRVEAKEDQDYQFPPLDLLTKVKPTDQSADLDSIKSNTQKLQDTLKSFGVDATVENVNLGPSVTKYELRPAVGVKVSRITNLADDLALALAAKDIRIEAPIPGKSLIGIEVPNQQIATVGFRDMIEAAPHDDRPLDVPLGRTVTGQVMTADLTKMPHLLIAGATGSGKSVAINVIITSILLKAKPSQVKMLMIDPKKVELSVYNGIPHLLSPVVSEPKKAARALGKVVGEMERRYELFAALGVRNLDGYNRMVEKENQNHTDPNEQQPTMPLILVIVDELADLMMTVSKDVEDAIVRIAQMGRAAGIHMILATQRPSVDVITGLIKANVPSRIAFAVSSGVDSRTIIDTNGAEKLLGRGDMLFEPIDQNKPIRIQGAFISDHDVEAVVNFIKNERPAEYDDQMMVSDAEMQQEEQKEDEDELFGEALQFVAQEQKASTSLIQRRFRIGYNRAARIIDDMEQRGYIGPANGSKPREVYKKPDLPAQ
ncbi:MULTISPECIES: FtsK/SpoIIIE family DNA translocase [Limosilactobacillus]|jgi:S-DNA-T family DNA segregation ATPase FtsK/SpoIIIE|uniref:DNA translocase FtsK n=2 Tax=Limosilactobacillus mucosae TaxID=97478 RepID=A0A099Y9T4_LIMMU|nr:MULTISPECIES: DNA translocase FtsK [Limosilactobacillus]KGL67019.1 cell division protein FtsK [Limosilactobacillus mucosae]MCC6097313.1 DNA translocase FtsK [Limosilactobacillus sp.]VTZ90115.1 DNA translocase FtsK [Limosilactobacillus mucosae]